MPVTTTFKSLEIIVVVLVEIVTARLATTTAVDDLGQHASRLACHLPHFVVVIFLCVTVAWAEATTLHLPFDDFSAMMTVLVRLLVVLFMFVPAFSIFVA